MAKLRENSGFGYTVAAVGAILMSYILAHFVQYTGSTTAAEGAVTGFWMDVGCYCVSGARLLGGEPECVYGEQALGSTGVDVDSYGTFRFPNDVVAQFDASFSLPERQRLEAVGEEGTLILEAPWRTDLGGRVLLNGETVPVDPADSYGLELANFAAAIAGDAKPLLGRDDALAQARVIEALYRSAESGEAVSL